MPHIGAVMERSLVEPQGFGEALRALVVRSVAAAVTKPADKRGISSSITDVKTAFSSWDNCMQAVYCKWPVIAIIAIGGLIILGVVWCIARCVCCGLSCCCECCYCLKCCGSCCGCCDPPHKKKYLDEPYIPPHHDQAYQPEAPMTAARAVPHSTPSYEGSVAKPEPPQYAEFDMGKKGGADDLPVMPSWESANSKKVLIEEEEVELEQLKKPEAAASLNAAGSTSASVSPVSPSAPFAGAPLPNNANNGYRMPPSRSTTDPYGANGYNNYGNGGGFNQSRDQLNQGYDQGYGSSGYGNNQGPGYGNQGYGGAVRREQDPYGSDYNAGGYGRIPMNQGQPPRAARSYDDYGRSVTPRSGPPRMGTPGNVGYGRPAPTASPAPYGAYGNPARMQSPAPPQQGGYGGAAYGNVNHTKSPAPQQGGYGYGQRSNTPNSYGRQYPPTPQRQYSNEVAQPAAPSDPVTQYATADTNMYDSDKAQSPIQNSGGFDFTSGYSRPTTAAPSPSASPAPQQPTGGGAAYPGYRAYKPAQ